MEKGKWEELNMDCLVNVFGRLGMESLLFDVPFVCKSWYKATLNPLCWQHLDFPETSDSFKSRLMDQYRSKGFKATELIQFAVNRSGGHAVSLVVPLYFTDEAFVCLVEGCPALKNLTLLPFCDETPFISRYISKWKNLEMLRLASSVDLEVILTQVSLHCKNFVDLGISRGYIEEDEALLIVSLLPNIKYLDLRRTFIDREALVRILKGCKKLLHFDVRNCKGFEGDDEILKLASHIPTFMYEGSRVSEDGSSDDETFPFYVYRIAGGYDEAWSDNGITMNDLLGVPCNIHPGGSGNPFSLH